ncbi:MAG: glycosyltransferase family 2 protein [Candidatus Omnitrophica bacterium]|nr:glycosyltransferase family 2 protein [Candidatus Omnitrophota bacterium]
MPLITAVIIVKDEEERVVKAIASARAVADEIIVVDDHSTDRTAEVARGLGCKVVIRALNDAFGAQRNAGAALARNDWILMIDADEVIPDKSLEEIRRLFANEVDSDALSVRIVNVMFGQPLYYSTGNCRYTRLYRRSRCSFTGDVHERLGIEGKVMSVNVEIWNDIAKSMDHIFVKTLRYTEIEARRYCDSVPSVSERMIRYELTWRSLKRFWKHYVKHKGFKDGFSGFILSIMNTIGPQIRMLKVWEQAKRQGKLVP